MSVSAPLMTRLSRIPLLSRATDWAPLDTLALGGIVVTAGAIRAFRLTSPGDAVFDEGFYTRDACFYISGSAPQCDLEQELSWTHPPLGKWMIALGIGVFGYRTGAWRVASLAAGTLTVIAVYLLARKILRSTVAAATASGLLAVDFLHFLHSRIAMLDVFLTLFVVIAVLFAVYDRGLIARRFVSPARPPPSLWDRRWRLAAGIAAGAAMATKWAGVWVIFALLALTLWWELSARREGGGGPSVRRTLREESRSLAGAYLLVPGLVYLATYIGRLDGTLLALPWSDGSWWRALVDRHLDMLSFHSGLELTHHSASPAWSWPLLKRPTLYFFRTDGITYREILGFGSPLVWWAGILGLLYVAWRGVRERGMDRPEWIIVAGFAAGWVPWIILAPVRDFVFLFYFLPAVPFLALALGYVAHRVWRSRAARAGVATFAVASVALFGFYYPLLTAAPLSPDAWQARIVFSGCEEELLARAGRLRGTDVPGPYPEALQNSVPPGGWCWL